MRLSGRIGVGSSAVRSLKSTCVLHVPAARPAFMDQATDETYQGLSHEDLVFRCQRTRSLVIKGAVAVVVDDLGSGRARLRPWQHWLLTSLPLQLLSSP